MCIVRQCVHMNHIQYCPVDYACVCTFCLKCQFYTQHIRLKTSPHAVKTYVVVSIRNNEYFSFNALRLLVGHES